MKASTQGKFTSAAGALETVTLGYEPSHIIVNNVTSNILYELINDGTNTSGTSTVGSTGVITQASEVVVATSNGFTITAATLTTADEVYYSAERLY